MTRRALAAFAVLAGFALAVPPTHAQRSAAAGNDGYRGFMDLSLITTSITSTTAEVQGMGARGWGLELGGGFFVKRFFLAGVQFMGQFAGDKKEFSNNTTGGTRSSSVGFFDVSLFAGLHSPGIALGEKWQLRLGVNLGKSWATGVRSIDNCSNCDREGLKIRGGVYYEPTVTFLVGTVGDGRDGGLFFSVRSYGAESDMRSAVLVGFRMFR